MSLYHLHLCTSVGAESSFRLLRSAGRRPWEVAAADALVQGGNVRTDAIKAARRTPAGPACAFAIVVAIPPTSLVAGGTRITDAATSTHCALDVLLLLPFEK